MSKLPPTWNPAVNVSETTAHVLLFLNKELSALLETVGLSVRALHLDTTSQPAVHPACLDECPDAFLTVAFHSAISGAEIWRDHEPLTWCLAFFARSVNGEIGFPRLACMHWLTGAGTTPDGPVDEFFAQDWIELREQLALGTQVLLEASLAALAQIAPIHRYGMHERVESFRMMCREVLSTGQEKK